jgi:hypothetical protein
MTQSNKSEEFKDYKNNKIPIALERKIRLTKISDDYFNGNHPNNIQEGFAKEGSISELPIIGERFYIGTFSTSLVKEVLDKEHSIIFKTLYSTYNLEFLE